METHTHTQISGTVILTINKADIRAKTPVLENTTYCTGILQIRKVRQVPGGHKMDQELPVCSGSHSCAKARQYMYVCNQSVNPRSKVDLSLH